MEIPFQISPSTISEDFVAKIYEAQAPNAEIGSQTVAAPHSAPYSVIFTSLDNIPHIVRLFGASSGNLLFSFDVLPTEDTVTIFTNIKFKIGDGQPLTPAAGDQAYINPILIGLTTDDFTVYRNGYGFLFEGIHFNFTSASGEIALIYPDQFGDGEEFLITRKPQAITTAVNDSVVGKQFGGNDTIPEMFVDVNTTVNYDPTHLRHLIRLAGANANYVLTGAIPIGYIFRITNFGAYADPADKGKVTFEKPLLWGNTTVTELDIQFSGTYEFEFDGTNWNCTMYTMAQETPAAQIVYAGTASLTVTSTDQIFTVNIPFQGVAPTYKVIGNLVSASGSWNNDNDVMCVIANKASASFQLALRRISSGGTQQLNFDFIIVK